MSYVEELERRAEELKQKLAEKQDKMPHWVARHDPDDGDLVTWFYILDDKLFGFVQYNETVPTHVTGKTKLSGFQGNTVEEIKACVERDFLGMFLAIDPVLAT
jgi:hypothetical protein